MRASTGSSGRRRHRSPLRLVFRHPIDVVPVTLILGVSAMQLLICFGAGGPLSALALTAILFPVQVNFAGMCHNHHHLNTFREPLLNRAFEVVMFLQLGMLPYVYTLHHNIGHHRYYLDQRCDSNRWRRPDGTTMGSWEFAWVLAVNIYPVAWRIGREHPRVLRRFRRMAYVCATVLLLLLVAAPINALIVFVLPLPFALLLQAQATYYQHAGLDTQNPWHASRSATAWLYNFRTFNLGYHTAHHFRPTLHWSKLPAFHETIADAIPRDLIL